MCRSVRSAFHVLAAALAAAPPAAHAQVVGVVRDNFGAPLAGAEVSIPGSAFAATTDAGGRFSLDFVPGEFSVAFAAKGHVEQQVPLKLFTKDRFPMAPVTLVRLPPADGFRLAVDSGYARVEARALPSRQRKAGQFKPHCTDLQPGRPPIASAPAFVAFFPESPAGNWSIVRPGPNGIPGMPGGLVDRDDCGELLRTHLAYKKMGGNQWMVSGELPDGVHCLARTLTLGGMMEYVDGPLACFTWRKAEVGAPQAEAAPAPPEGGEARRADPGAPPGAPAAAAARPAGNPFTPGSVWAGSYACGQWKTDLTLTIVGVEGGRVSGLFQFAVPGRPAPGVYRIAGDYDAGTSSIAFKAGEWVDRPEGFGTVGLSGTVGADGSSFDGKIDAPACSTFATRKKG